MNIRSVRFRLAIFFVAFFGTTYIVLGVLGYQFFVRNQQEDFDIALYNHAMDVAATINVDMFGRLAVYGLNPGEHKMNPFPLERSFLQIRSIEGVVLARSDTLGRYTLPMSSTELDQVLKSQLTFKTIASENIQHPLARRFSAYRQINVFLKKDGVPPLILQIAVPMSFVERNNRDLRIILLVAILSVLLAATIGAYKLSKLALAPVMQIIDKAKNIGVGQLSERIPLPSTQDEIHLLVVTFNELLERIEVSVRAGERFVANASHQIKTPLAILRGELEVLLSARRSEDELRAFVKSASEEIAALTGLIEKLLILARVDAGIQSLSFSKERIDEIVIETVGSLESYARKNDHTIKLELLPSEVEQPSFEFWGDAGLIRSVLQALIENAIKYSAPHEGVSVAITESNDEVSVKVTNKGSGISQEDLPHIFDRFFRSRRSEPGTAGFGLGLAIVKRIVELHGGRVEVMSEIDKVTCFALYLKRSQDSIRTPI